MPTHEHILDNQRRSVAEYLREKLRDADNFRLVSAYFTINGYELLAQELSRLARVNFLFGDPSSVDSPDPGPSDPKSFELTEEGLVPNHALNQKHLALQCAQWIGSNAVAVRSVSKANFLHGKLYLTESPRGAAGVVGSSNFTKTGLGASENSNLEINLATADSATLGELRDWFDKLWNDKHLTRDVKQEVLNALNRIGKDHAPEIIYFKTLYELFRKEIEARREGEQRLQDTHLYDTAIWNALYEFQKDGAKSVISRLRQHNGCILADSVGLGKTYTALAVIKHYEMENENVLVMCPRKLRENWSLYRASVHHQDNPFKTDRFGYALLSHTDLSRKSGKSGDIDLAKFDWRNFGLVVIDESHNFRNMEGERFQRLLKEVIQQGARTRVLMLSATPVNTSLTDLRNQIYLITEGREDDFMENLGVGNLRNMLGNAQKEFKKWESGGPSNGGRDKAELLDRLGAEFFRLLGGISISRSRRQIKQFYATEMDHIGRFPTHATPVNKHPFTDLQGSLSYQAVADQIDEFALSIYRPTDYLVDETRLQELEAERQERNFDQRDRERFLIGMIRTNFLKRLESSAHSLRLTLERTIGKIDLMLKKIDNYERGRRIDDDQAGTLPDDDEDDEEFIINRGRNPYRLNELDLSAWREDLERDKATLGMVLDKIREIRPERDGKLEEIKQAIRHRAENPTTDQDGKSNRKLLVFTTFKDTAEYVYENVTRLATELELNTAMVSGDGTSTNFGDNNFNAILTNFAPMARNRGSDETAGEIDLLIATDCISEGQNLQDCDTVLNYDIHWNPVRLIQRFGRIDRIGSRSSAVHMVNYWPTKDMDAYLRLANRVQARMALADVAASGDEDPFTEELAQQELNFRDKQLVKLRQEILDLDDLADTVVMSDFTLDHFLTQLLRFLDKNREELEATPLGAYAIADGDTTTNDYLPPSVIFVLRQRNASMNRRQQTASPVHPHYLVHIRRDGTIRYGCANARQVLTAFEEASAGRSEPLTKLCDWFDRATDHGKNMDHYERLLTRIIDHIRESHNTTQLRGLGIGGRRDFVLPRASEAPRDEQDFELVTWLVISSGEHSGTTNEA